MRGGTSAWMGGGPSGPASSDPQPGDVFALANIATGFYGDVSLNDVET